MKITKTQLRQIIKEELEKSLEEAWGQPFGDKENPGGVWTTATDFPSFSPREAHLSITYDILSRRAPELLPDVETFKEIFKQVASSAPKEERIAALESNQYPRYMADKMLEYLNPWNTLMKTEEVDNAT
jgi:hypothetical protein